MNNLLLTGKIRLSTHFNSVYLIYGFIELFKAFGLLSLLDKWNCIDPLPHNFHQITRNVKAPVNKNIMKSLLKCLNNIINFSTGLLQTISNNYNCKIYNGVFDMECLSLLGEKEILAYILSFSDLVFYY